MSPGQLLEKYLVSFIKETNLPGHLETEVPKKWEKYGDFVLFDERTLCSEVWKKQDEYFWLKICEILKCNRIGVKNRIKNDGFRSPNVTILYGTNPWVLHKDNSVIYTWNVERCMFSAGNICEKIRIAKLNCESEVIVDLFAGIGYFTLPFLVHSKAAFVHACEWNPDAVEALNRNLELNKVKNKCRIYEGDNQVVCPKNVANRVNLGLIPTSEKHWRTACDALVEEGGILHIHENVETKNSDVSCKCCQNSLPDSEQIIKNISMSSESKIVTYGSNRIAWKNKQWLVKGIHILHSIVMICANNDSSKVWNVTIENVNFVKSYAPHVNHLVYDVKIECNRNAESESA